MLSSGGGGGEEEEVDTSDFHGLSSSSRESDMLRKSTHFLQVSWSSTKKLQILPLDHTRSKPKPVREEENDHSLAYLAPRKEIDVCKP